MGFQPVPRDRCAWTCEIGNDMVASKSRRSIGAGHRLEAYATLGSILWNPIFRPFKSTN